MDGLITDIQRYLAGRPILARPQTTTYRLTKFIRRNRKAVVAGVFAVIALTATSGYALWRQHQAVIAGERALQMQTFMYQLFKLANSNYMGKPAAIVPEFLQLGVKVLPDFIKDPADQRAALLSLAESMYDNTDYADAQPVLTQVIASSKRADDLGTEAEAEIFSGVILNLLGQAKTGQPLEAHALSLAHKPGVTSSARVWIEGFYAMDREKAGFHNEENVRLLQAAVDESRKQHLPDRETAWALQQLSYVYVTRGTDLPKAEDLSQQALDIYRREPYALCDQSQTEIVIGRIRAQLGNYQGSQQMYGVAHDGFSTCMGPHSPNALATEIFIASAMVDQGKTPQDAVNILEQTLPALRKIVPDGSTLAPVFGTLARAYLQTGEYAKAETAAEQAIAAQQGQVNPISSRVAVCELLLAHALAGEGRSAEALRHAEAADRIYSSISTLSPAEKRDAAGIHEMVVNMTAHQQPVSVNPSGVSQKH